MVGASSMGPSGAKSPVATEGAALGTFPTIFGLRSETKPPVLDSMAATVRTRVV